MEIDIQYIAIFIAIFIFMCYLLYKSCQIPKYIKNNNEAESDEDEDEDEESDKNNCYNSKKKILNPIIKKGIKAYANCNNLEEIPKFL
jgi:hypothetical protein